MKKYDKKRYTNERSTSSGTQVYDSYANNWVFLSVIASSDNGSSHCSSSSSSGYGYGDCDSGSSYDSSSSDSGSCGGD